MGQPASIHFSDFIPMARGHWDDVIPVIPVCNKGLVWERVYHRFAYGLIMSSSQEAYVLQPGHICIQARTHLSSNQGTCPPARTPMSSAPPCKNKATKNKKTYHIQGPRIFFFRHRCCCWSCCWSCCYCCCYCCDHRKNGGRNKGSSRSSSSSSSSSSSICV